MNKILLVDLCGTVVRENTTFHMLDLLEHKNFILKNRKSILVKFLNKFLMAIFGYDFIKSESIKSLNGKSKNYIEELSKSSINSMNFNTTILKLIEEKRNNGYKIILVTATLDTIAEQFSKIVNADDIISSKLSFDGELCEGKLHKDILLSKIEEVNYLFDLSCRVEMITDNKTDLDVCKKCDSFYSISYNKKDSMYWKNKGSKIVFEI